MIQRADKGANRFPQFTNNNENAAAQNRCSSKQTEKNSTQFLHRLKTGYFYYLNQYLT